MKTITTLLAIASMAVAAGQASAQGKGPRASVASSTQCALDNGMLIVTTTLTNKSSGTTIAAVTGGTVQATYKPLNSRGNASLPLGGVVYIDAADVDPVLEVSAKFDLCDGMGGVRDEVDQARELNATATVHYGVSDSDGETRTVTNRCTDDPDTAANEGGIKVEDVYQDIVFACMNPIPTTESTADAPIDPVPSTEVLVPEVETTTETTTTETSTTEASATADAS